jgi:peptidoglycan/LPS O-acetylase OafA/YrhL
LSQRLSDCLDKRDNNFNLIRLLAASLVILSHSYPLTGIHEEPLTKFGINYGYLAVDAFFIVSGFLVTKSFFTKDEVGEFIWDRVLRIYPGLIASVVCTVFVIGAASTRLSVLSYLSRVEVYWYLIDNAIMLRPFHFMLPGVFETNTFRAVINGSLWTLPWELRMYSILGILGFLAYYRPRLLSKHRLKSILVALCITATIAYLASHYLLQDKGNTAVRFMSLFFMGSVFFVYAKRMVFSRKALLPIAAAFMLAFIYSRFFFFVYVICFGYVVMYLAYVPGGVIRRFNRLGDYSYGTYIYAFPLQQSITAVRPDIGIFTLFAVSLALTLPIAIASWYLLEKRMLARKAQYHRLKLFMSGIGRSMGFRLGMGK